MSPNITEVFESFVFPMDELGYNSTFGNDYTDTISLQNSAIDENATQLILSNGTRTRAPKYSRKQFRVSAMFEIMTVLSYYTCPAILAIGLLSNILAYLVFTRTRLRKVPSVPYLAAIAFVDSGVLITEFVQKCLKAHGISLITIAAVIPAYNSYYLWLGIQVVFLNTTRSVLLIGSHLTLRSLSPSQSQTGICQYATYLNFVFIFLSMWYPVALCVEKFISVYCPLRKDTLCTPFRAKVVVISMAVMTGTCYYYVIYMTGSYNFGLGLFCREWKVFRTDFRVLMQLDLIFVNVLPNIILIVLMILICCRGCEYYRISSAVEISSRAGSTRSSSNRVPVRVTNVIFPVAFMILLLNLPLTLTRIYHMVFPGLIKVFSDLMPLFLYISRFVWAIKLYIYLAFSPSFRRRTKSYLCSILAKIKSRCRRDASEDEEEEVIGITPRINLAERRERGANPRACLMSSDV